jgi:hypothetical protein
VSREGQAMKALRRAGARKGWLERVLEAVRRR